VTSRKTKVALVVTKNACDYNMTDEHSDGTRHEKFSTAETIDKEDCWERKQKIDDSENTGSK
jgi:hypothetical protein